MSTAAFFDSETGHDTVADVESRKGWRNRDAGAAEGVLALLEGLRTGLGAQGVGLFDDDRADLDVASSGGGALNFWDAFDRRPCGEIDWEGWYGALRREGRVDTTCGCGGAHRLCGYLLHGRWVLLIIAPAGLASAPAASAVASSGGAADAAAVASSLKALAARLPPAMTAHEREAVSKYEGGRGVGGAAAVTPPVWWVRKPPQ